MKPIDTLPANNSSNTATSNSTTVLPTRKTAQIFQFPEGRIVRRPETQESLNDTLLEHKITFLLEVQDDLLGQLYVKLLHSGLKIDESDENFARDWGFTIECFRSMLYRQYGIEHDFHKIVDDRFEVTEAAGIEVGGPVIIHGDDDDTPPEAA